jgi:alpha-D-ribose 1-methylphosphonate 5-triphosphate diphosphatase PhnM
VNEAALRICASGIEPERLILVSDAVARGRVLAPDILRNWLRVTGSAVPNAVRMLSLTPAQALGLDDRRGAIAPGLDAVLVIWKGEFEEVDEVLG